MHWQLVASLISCIVNHSGVLSSSLKWYLYFVVYFCCFVWTFMAFFLFFILCIRFGVDFLRVTVSHDPVTLGGAKCMCSSAEELSFNTWQELRNPSVVLCGKSSDVGNAKSQKLGLWFWWIYSSIWEPNLDLVQQLRAISKPAFSVGLMEIKTFLQNSEGLGDLTSQFTRKNCLRWVNLGMKFEKYQERVAKMTMAVVLGSSTV